MMCYNKSVEWSTNKKITNILRKDGFARPFCIQEGGKA